MQSVVRENKNIHPLLDELDRFYSITSEAEYKPGLVSVVFDESFKGIQELFNQYAQTSYNFSFRKKKYDKIRLSDTNKKNIVVCVSGGKDSLAAVMRYQQLGYNVYLYHMKHINPALTDEWKVCLELAEYLKLPIFIDTIKLSGHHDWVEHPMKNMIIANGALSYAIKEGIGTKIAFGNYYTSSVEYDNFIFCGGDDIEMWKVYEKIIRKIIPGFKMHVCLRNLGTTLNTVCKNKELLNRSISCLGRSSMRDYWRNWVKTKYGITLPNHRCGRCYKCQVEYVYMADHGLQEYNEEYYKYCMRGLKRNYKNEQKVKYVGWYEVWNDFFFYDIRKAHMIKLLTLM